MKPISKSRTIAAVVLIVALAIIGSFTGHDFTLIAKSIVSLIGVDLDAGKLINLTVTLVSTLYGFLRLITKDAIKLPWLNK